MVYDLKDGTFATRDTKRGQEQFERLYKDEIKSKCEPVKIWDHSWGKKAK